MLEERRQWRPFILMQVLEHWHKQGHRALLFTQTQQMLDIVERAVQNADMNYHRMDGSTAVSLRARLVDDFNDNASVFVFLLTTKVGGVGINLTGANRYVSILKSISSSDKLSLNSKVHNSNFLPDGAHCKRQTPPF